MKRTYFVGRSRLASCPRCGSDLTPRGSVEVELDGDTANVKTGWLNKGRLRGCAESRFADHVCFCAICKLCLDTDRSVRAREEP